MMALLYTKTTLNATNKAGFLELVRTSIAVSIGNVLGDKPIVVTPSHFWAWHGVVVGFSP